MTTTAAEFDPVSDQFLMTESTSGRSDHLGHRRLDVDDIIGGARSWSWRFVTPCTATTSAPATAARAPALRGSQRSMVGSAMNS
jgi:hypothetical protein